MKLKTTISKSHKMFYEDQIEEQLPHKIHQLIRLF